MAEPSDFQSGENGQSCADNSATPSERGMWEGMEPQQQEEIGSNEEASSQTSEFESSLNLGVLFNEMMDRTRQPGHYEQLIEVGGGNEEELTEASDSEDYIGLEQLFDEEADQMKQPGDNGQLNEMEHRNEVEFLDVNLARESPIKSNLAGGTKEDETLDGIENQAVLSGLRLLHLALSLNYNYQPLSSPDSARILVLLPTQKVVDDLRCHLDEVRLSDVKDKSEGFTALSYAWGASEASHVIWFGTHILRIRPNLDNALRNLRRPDRSIRLWVDAVCINQNDLLERNHQVQQMRDIFSAASETIIYLGPQDGGVRGHLAWDFLERHSSSWALDKDRNINRSTAARLDKHLVHFRGDLKDVELEVLSRPWFRRLWVFQEAVVSRSLSIQCGNRRISWDDFCEILLLSPRLHNQYGFSFEDENKLDIVRDINISRREYLRYHGLERFLPSWQLPATFGPSQGVLDILTMLSRARYLEASDERDKIYGLVGISTGIDINDQKFAVDYRLSYRELYIRFARNCIEARGSYDIFSYIDTATESLMQFPPQRGPLLPSWVPNWHYQKYISYGSNRTILETLPVETPVARKARQDRVGRGYYVPFVRRGAKTKTMVVQGRILGRIDRDMYTLPLRVLGMDEARFQDARTSAKDESQSFKSIMQLWQQILYFDVSESTPQEAEAPRKSPAGWDMAAVESPPRARLIASHFREARMKNPTSVEYHMYSRARQTENWWFGKAKLVIFTDKESIVDGKRLVVCSMETEPVQQLALVPSMAHEGDLVVQISGSRVPFIVTKTPGVAWPGEEVDPSLLSRMSAVPLKHTTCQLVGECLLNDFEELPEDKMDRWFVIV